MSFSYTQASPIDLRLPQVPEVTDPTLFAEFSKVYNALQNLSDGITQLTGAIARDPSTWSSLQPTDTIRTQNLNRSYYMATETIPFGNVVNIWDDGSGVPKIRKAYANVTDIRPSHGFCNTAGGITLGDYGEVILVQGLTAGISGLTIGTTYYLSITTPGIIQSAKPVAPHLIQSVGFALSTTLFYYFAPMV